jgi:hypothetical protein
MFELPAPVPGRRLAWPSDERLSGQSFPWKIDFYAAGTIVERPGMVEPRWPMRTFKVKFPRTLCDPGQLRDRGGWVVPVDIEADALCICPCDRDGWRKRFEEALYTFWLNSNKGTKSLTGP